MKYDYKYIEIIIIKRLNERNDRNLSNLIVKRIKHGNSSIKKLTYRVENNQLELRSYINKS